jgi:hypothetical protein
LTATFGILATTVGAKTPVVFGLVLILGLGLILVGVVVMLIMGARQPEFFRGEAVIHESAHEHMARHEHLMA